MKKQTHTTTDNDLLTDDEALREAAMRDGTKRVGKFKLRPCVPGTISIIRSNQIGRAHV